MSGRWSWGATSSTGGRYLESLVFEVACKRSAKDTRIRAEGFARPSQLLDGHHFVLCELTT